MKKIRLCNNIVIVIAFQLFLSACDSKSSIEANKAKISDYILSVKQGDKAPIEPFPELPDITVAKPEIKRNIFYAKGKKIQENPLTEKIELKKEDFSYKKYKVLSIKVNTKEKYALLRSPNKSVYRKKAGDIFGKEKAKIVAINSNSITISVKNKREVIRY